MATIQASEVSTISDIQNGVTRYADSFKYLTSESQGALFQQISLMLQILTRIFHRADIHETDIDRADLAVFTELFQRFDEVIANKHVDSAEYNRLINHIIGESFALMSTAVRLGRVSENEYESLKESFLQQDAKLDATMSDLARKESAERKQYLASLSQRDLQTLVIASHFTITPSAVTSDERLLSLKKNQFRARQHIRGVAKFKRKASTQISDIARQVKETTVESEQFQQEVDNARQRIHAGKAKMQTSVDRIGEQTSKFREDVLLGKEKWGLHASKLRQEVEEAATQTRASVVSLEEEAKGNVQRGVSGLFEKSEESKKEIMKARTEVLIPAKERLSRNEQKARRKIVVQRLEIQGPEKQRLKEEHAAAQVRVKSAIGLNIDPGREKLFKDYTDARNRFTSKKEEVERVHASRFRGETELAKTKFTARARDIVFKDTARIEAEAEEARGRFTQRAGVIIGTHKVQFVGEVEAAKERFKQKGAEIEGTHKIAFEEETKVAQGKFVEKSEELGVVGEVETAKKRFEKPRGLMKRQRDLFLYDTRQAKYMYEKRATEIQESALRKSEEFQEKQEQFVARANASRKSKMIRTLLRTIREMNR